VDALYGARRSQAHLSSVITHAAITLWAVDKDGIITVAEGNGAKKLKLVQTTPSASEGSEPSHQSDVTDGLQDGRLRQRPKPGRMNSPTLVGKSIFDVWKPETKDHIARALRGETVVKEMEMDGRWFRTSYTPIRERSMLFPSVYSDVLDENEEITGVVGASLDITDQKKTQKMMEESNQEKVRALAAATAAEGEGIPLRFLRGRHEYDRRGESAKERILGQHEP
jgi:PAS domain-containing protein